MQIIALVERVIGMQKLFSVVSHSEEIPTSFDFQCSVIPRMVGADELSGLFPDFTE